MGRAANAISRMIQRQGEPLVAYRLGEPPEKILATKALIDWGNPPREYKLLAAVSKDVPDAAVYFACDAFEAPAIDAEWWIVWQGQRLNPLSDPQPYYQGGQVGWIVGVKRSQR